MTIQFDSKYTKNIFILDIYESYLHFIHMLLFLIVLINQLKNTESMAIIKSSTNQLE